MIRREALKEYAGAALWVLPFVAGNVALLAGLGVSHIDAGPGSPLASLAFQGTAQDARDLLTAITGTVVTVIALVLGLSVVALQMASTQFSPRLLRNFLRDRPNQLVLSVFMATFAYCAAGLFTVGVAGGERTEDIPRLAVSGAIAMLFASLAMVVYFADHLSHSIQIDAIMRRVERETLQVVRANAATDVELDPPTAPSWAVPVPATTSGYVQTAHPEHLLSVAIEHGVVVALERRVGEHVVAGTPLAWVWRSDGTLPAPDPHDFQRAVDAAVGIGFERTRQQDAAIGIRQLVDVACKALSPAVNDPYTAVQSVDHLSVIFSELTRRPLGPTVARDAGGHPVVIVPSRRFGEYLATMCGLIRRYGSREPTVAVALLRLLRNCATFVHGDQDRLDAIAEQGRLILDDAKREVAEPADVVAVRDLTEVLLRYVAAAGGSGPVDQTGGTA
jgi:uncharacterized membrane protein